MVIYCKGWLRPPCGTWLDMTCWYIRLVGRDWRCWPVLQRHGGSSWMMNAKLSKVGKHNHYLGEEMSEVACTVCSTTLIQHRLSCERPMAGGGKCSWHLQNCCWIWNCYLSCDEEKEWMNLLSSIAHNVWDCQLGIAIVGVGWLVDIQALTEQWQVLTQVGRKAG